MTERQQILKTLESLTDLDLKAMSEQEILAFRNQIGKSVNEFYTLTNIEIRRKKKV